MNQPNHIDRLPPQTAAEQVQPTPLIHKTLKELNTANPFLLPVRKYITREKRRGNYFF